MKFECKCGTKIKDVQRFPLHCACARVYVLVNDSIVEKKALETAKEPGIITKIAGVSKAYAKWAMSGFQKRTDEEQEAVKAICVTCEFYNALKNKCSKCGCGLAKKIPIATESCPEGKWLAIDHAAQASTEGKPQ
jgi:hypothetical protein